MRHLLDTDLTKKMNEKDPGVNRLFTKSTAVNKDMEARQSDRIWTFSRELHAQSTLVHRYSQFSVYI